LQLLATLRFLNSDSLSTVLYTFYSLNVDESAGISAQLARSYVNIGFAVSLVSLHSAARSYLKRGMATARAVDAERTSPQAMCWAYTVSALYHAGVADWRRTLPDLAEAERINTALGDPRGFFPIYAIWSTSEFFLGHYARSLELSTRLSGIGEKHNDPQSRMIGFVTNAYTLMVMGRLAEAEAQVKQAEKPSELAKVSEGDKLVMQGVHSAITALREGPKKGFEPFQEHLDKFLKLRPTSLFGLYCFNAVVPLLLTLWESGQADVAATARQACKAFNRLSRIFFVVQPDALRCQGLCDWLSGDHASAMRNWQRSHERAQSLDIPYAEARALYEMARHLPADDPEGKNYLASAKAKFQALGVTAPSTERAIQIGA
jgi:hypothetical protein